MPGPLTDNYLQALSDLVAKQHAIARATADLAELRRDLHALTSTMFLHRDQLSAACLAETEIPSPEDLSCIDALVARFDRLAGEQRESAAEMLRTLE